MTNALATTNTADINATLRALGLMEPEGTSDYNRAKINGTTFELGEDVYPSNQVKKTPAFIGRILEMPDEYQGVFLTQEEADQIGRPDIGERFCKSHYDAARYPNEAEPGRMQGKYAEDGTECRQCPINPFIKRNDSPLEGGKKCQWRGDILFQLCEADGTTIDPRPWTLSMSTTGMIELKGMRKEPTKGYVSDLNFMQLLARLGIETFPEADPAAAVSTAATALALGGIVAEFRLIQAKSADGSRSFPVVNLTPIAILEGAQPHSSLTQLPATAAAAAKNVTPSAEELPF